MIVVDGVEDLPPQFARADEMHLAQPAQLMGNGGFGHAEAIRECVNAHFPVHQLCDDADAARVAEGAEEFGKFNGSKFTEFHG